jgi:hypothetical protein
LQVEDESFPTQSQHAALQPSPFFAKKQWPPMLSTKPSTSYLQPSEISIHSLAEKSQIPFNMSQIITTVNSKANGVAVRDGNDEPIADARDCGGSEGEASGLH